MQLQAASIGSTVPQDNFNATIQSIFDSSCNLRLEQEDRLITILASDHYDLPQGIRLNEKIPLQSLTVGLRAASRGGILRFDSSRLRIDLRGAPIWNEGLPALIGNIEQAWAITWRALNEGQRTKGAELAAEDLFRLDRSSRLSCKLRQPVLQLIAATERFDPFTSADAAQKMIGLGPGLTPSGDDMLIGFLAGLQAIANDREERKAFIQTFGNALLTLSRKTNEISRTYLFHAVKGEFSSSIVALIESIRGGDEPQLLSSLANAIRVGHSSGMDAVTGLLIGLAVWGAGPFYSDYKETSLWQLHSA